jgi:DNA polymerase-3 subunit gamma/tau
MSSDYVVLARKYRPLRFQDIVGQESLVNTLKKCIIEKTIPHAFILNGIRGVGKTTAARIMAKALNCEMPEDGYEPCGKCNSCIAVDKGNHLDIVEMDAASRTSVDDAREIISSTQYKAVMGKFKVFIIDEVHMLSKSAFNAFLKTLEEPPLHVKFIFATTEIKKIPETVLSRCMRFDLKRIGNDDLKNHLKSIANKENVKADDAGINLIVRCSGGSARDAMSLMNQCISMNGGVFFNELKLMLGLSDNDLLWDLLKNIFDGDPEKTIKTCRDIISKGADSVSLVEDLLDLLYKLSCLKSSPSLINDSQWMEDEIGSANEFVKKHSMGQLLRAWQILLKGHIEVAKSPLVDATLEMLLLQICYLSDAPTPVEISNSKSNIDSLPTSSGVVSASSATISEEPKVDVVKKEAEKPKKEPKSLIDIVNALNESRELIVLSHLEHDAHFIKVENYVLSLNIKDSAPKDFKKKIESILSNFYKKTFRVLEESVKNKPQTIAEEREEKRNKIKNDVFNIDVVKQLKESMDISSIDIVG